jgi:hypothetical protein
VNDGSILVKFFVPECTPENEEQIYGELAAWCRRSPPSDDGERVYSIHWTHDGEVWTATVGQRLSGERMKRRRQRGEWRETRTPLKDGAVVLAIFAPDPFMVVTNAAPTSRVLSKWANPFMAGEPSSVTYFRTDHSEDCSQPT